MAKYDFSLSRYNKLWDSQDEGRAILSKVLTDPELIRSNFTFWKEKFLVDPNVTPTASTGIASFVSQMRMPQKSYLMHMRAPLGDTIVKGKEGVEKFTGTIPNFISDGFNETAMERQYKEEMFVKNFGNDAFLVSQFVDEVQTLVDGANQTLSYLSAQLLSTGKTIYDKGEGVQASINDNNVPEANKTHVSKVWSNKTTKILTEMIEIEKKYKELWGAEIPMRWEIPYDMFVNVFLKNDEVIERVRYMKSLDNVLLPTEFPVTRELFEQAIATYDGLSPIYITEEKQRDYNGMVHGWADGIAVLRPNDYAGYIRHSEILDKELYSKYGSSVISWNYGTSGDGLFTIMNSVHNNGNLKEWHTALAMNAVPTLDQFLYHVIVDTTRTE